MIGLMCMGSVLDSVPVIANNIHDLTLVNGKYDVLRVDNNIVGTGSEVDTGWYATTHLCANFTGNLYGGNSELGIDSVSNILVKRREVGTFKWFNLFDIVVEDTDDFDFNLVDRYARLSTPYEYAIVPIINGLEGAYSIAETHKGDKEITVKYDGVIILDPSAEYATVANITYSEALNNGKQDITTMDLQYPITITNANAYYTGSVSGAFFKMDGCAPVIADTPAYVRRLMAFLNNDNKKILKYRDGTMYMCDIIGAISKTSDNHPDINNVSFNFTEKGSCESNSDMYWNGFLDISEAWWSE